MYRFLQAVSYPVVTVTGPRQSGKTTLVKNVFPHKPYANLESIQVRERVEADPVGFLDSYPNGAILDEIQRCPGLLSEIQVRVDETKIQGMFILTGSYQVGLRSAIAQSLAGRTSILHLLPMSMEEFTEAKIHFTLDEILYQGCFPRIHKDHLDPTKAYSNYTQTYLERDLRQMIEVKDLQLFQKFLKLCAGRIGQVFNKESLAGEVGVTSKTITHWLSILEASYLIFLLPPYFENFGKRAIKSPKLYFCDVGLAAYLLGIESISQMERDPLRGHLVENLIILELIKARWNQGLEHRLYFYRDSHHNEIDVIFQRGHDLIPIEIKSAKTFNRSFLKELLLFKNLVGNRCQDPALIYSGLDEHKIQDIQLWHFSHASQAKVRKNFMDLNLKNKKALVTGSSSGIGEGIAKCLAREGVHVMIHGRKKQELQRVVNEIHEKNGIAHYVEGDLTNESDIKHIISTTLEIFQQLDILVNNAGAFPKRGWIESTPQNWLDLFNVNVVAMVRLIQAFLPQMKTLGWGRIIQIASVAGISPSSALPEYGVTKSAAINMSISLAKDLKGTGITVNSVSPGPIATTGTQELFHKIALEHNWGTSWEEIEKKITSETLPNIVGRFGTCEEVGNLVTFLASPLASFITGANYRIDGGRLA